MSEESNLMPEWTRDFRVDLLITESAGPQSDTPGMDGTLEAHIAHSGFILQALSSEVKHFDFRFDASSLIGHCNVRLGTQVGHSDLNCETDLTLHFMISDLPLWIGRIFSSITTGPAVGGRLA